MKKYLLLSLSIFICSCRQKENKNPVSNTSEDTVSSSDESVSIQETEKNEQIEDTLYMKHRNKEGLFVAESALDSIHSKIYVKFDNEKKGKLTATLLPTTGKGNIRFSQIIYPDATANGPFGKDLEVDLKQKGTYILVVGHSLMADNPFWGSFKIQLDHK
jgi:hypothetical protein